MLYDIGFFIFSLFYLPALLFKGKFHGNYLQRFAIYDDNIIKALSSGKDKIWIEAVSVGEVALCKGLISSLKKEFPGYRIVLSTITKTGNDLAKRLFSKEATVIYFPLDFSLIVRPSARLINPKVYIMIETEIWPNLLKRLYSASIPSILINGRISDKSFGRYSLVRPFLKSILEKINLFCMQSRLDADRVMALGAPSERVRVTGNMKFDIESIQNIKSPLAIKESLNLKEGDELLVAGSTHAGEEDIIVEAYGRLKLEFPRLKLLIAPRHIDRVAEVEETVKRFGFEPIRVSSLPSKLQAPLACPYRKPGQASSKFVIILDTIGQLNDIYSIATLVFIGGSLVRHGGHNPIEPAIFERPILFGPHMFNFKTIASVFLEKKAAFQVADGAGLFEKCKFLLKNRDEMLRLGSSAKKVVSENSGATLRNIKAIKELLTVSS